MKLHKILLCLLIIYLPVQAFSQSFLYEGFESGSKPEGWTEETVSGNEPWRYRNGGHSPNDNNWQVPAGQEDITRNPPSAYEGTYNAIFFKQGDNNERTKLITPAMNLLGATAVELSFYLCQIPWTFEGSTGWDVLRVYYKVSDTDPWVLLHEYLDPVYEWEQKKLTLPNPSDTYYVAFEGHTRWGYGTCIDSVSIVETGSQPMYIADIDFQQPFSNYIPSGTPDVPMMRVDFKVFGNTDSVMLNNIQFTSLNTSDSDILPGGIKLYNTTSQSFSNENPLGSPSSFSSGVASFTGLDHSLPAGLSYLWLTYDLDQNAEHKHILDVKVEANGISSNGNLYPASDQSPEGFREVFETRYHQDFEGTHNWILTGEFEVNTPNGMGGTPGNPNPPNAFRGTKSLGTDLTGLGANPYNYEPGLSEAASYYATSPNIDVLYYKDMNLFFRRYLNIEVWDNASIEISTDDGITWNSLWESNSYLSDFQWFQTQIPISDDYSRSDQLQIRYKLGPTDGFNNYSGWNIDDIYLTGEFISKDVGVSEWIYPLSGSGHTANDSVTVRIRNYGGAEIVDPVPVAYSFDGGDTWTVNLMNSSIPVGGSVVFTFPTRADLSEPGPRPLVLAKTAMPGDQFTGNDQISTEIYIVPTYTPPYEEDFESGEGFWRSLGNGLWENGTPAGTVINAASSGTKSWATGLSASYGDVIAEKSKTLFEDDFETDMGWTFSGEFERATPNNTYLPYFADSGYYCLGTDLSGLGTYPYEYENGITPGTAFTATSPAFDVTDYSSLQVNFASWITIQNGDSIKLEVSPDNGSTWHTIWKNSEGSIMDLAFEYREYPIPDTYTYTDALKIRFSLFYSSSGGAVAEGWNIDDFLLTGDLVDSEPGFLSSPSFDLTGIIHPVFMANLWTDSELDMDGATLYYSLDDGENWTAVTNTSGYDAYWNWYTGSPVGALGTDGWSGLSGGWITVTHLLPPAVADQENVQVRLTFKTDKEDNQYDGMAVDDVRILEAPKDMDILEILDPVSACELSEEQSFTLRLRNSGLSTLQPGDSIRIGYHIDRSGEIQTFEETYTLAQTWPAGNTKDLLMSGAFDFSKSGEYLTTIYFHTSFPHFYSPASNDTVSQSIEVNKPALELGEDISTVRPDTVILRAFSGVPGQTYLWQDSSTDSLFHVTTEGSYHVRVTNGIGCVASDTVQVLQLISDVGVSTYLGPLSACELSDQLPLQIRIENMGTDTVEVGDTIFIGGIINSTDSFTDTIVLTQRFKPGEAFDFSYSRIFDFSSPGDYQMKLFTGLTEDAYAANDTLFHTLQVFGYPDANLGPDTVVIASEYLLAPAPGYFEYLWQDGSTGETFTIDQPGQGQYHVTVSDENQCISTDTVIVTLNVLDLMLDQLLAPSTSCELSESITVSARIKNSGNQAIPSGENITMGYRIDDGPIVQEGVVLTENLLSGHTLDFTFSNAETVQTGEWYDFTVFVDYANDTKSWNDTVITSVGVFETPALDLGEEYQVITGFEHTLDAGPGFASYEWQDGSTNQTYTITTPGIGLYGVTVTDDNGCTVYDEIEIFLAAPDVGIQEVLHPATTCHLEESEHIQVIVKNYGNWDIDPSSTITVSYSINGAPEVSETLPLDSVFENGAVIHHTFSQEEDFSEPGLYSIMVYTSFESDLVPTNDLVLVSVDHYGSPDIDIGNGEDTLLVYEPITLSATPGYTSYLWHDGSTGTDYSITDPSSGWYNVLVTADNGCVTHDSVFVAYDQPDLELLRLVNPVSSCSLETNTVVSIEIVNNGYFRISTRDTLIITYSVNSGSSVIEAIQLDNELPAGQSVILPFATTSDFSEISTFSVQASLIWATDGNISNNLITTSVTVWGQPDVEIGDDQEVIYADLPLTLDAGTGYAEYLWQNNSTGSTFEVTEEGQYWVTVTDQNGCSDTDSVYVESGTSVYNPYAFPGEVRIYPNPAEEMLFVDLNLEEEQSVTLELYTIAKSLVFREDIRNVKVRKTHIDVQDLTPGSYFLRITVDHATSNFLVIVE